MEDTNPYAPPTSDIVHEGVRENLQEYSTAQLKSFSNAWRRIGGVALVCAVFSSLICTIMLISLSQYSFRYLDGADFFVFSVTLFSILTSVGVYRHRNWGYVMMVIMCIGALLVIPIGTLLGISGLAGLVKGNVFFGPKHLTFKEVKEEYKIRKQNNIK